jgi:quinol monooxygenase YgiN
MDACALYAESIDYKGDACNWQNRQCQRTAIAVPPPTYRSLLRPIVVRCSEADLLKDAPACAKLFYCNDLGSVYKQTREWPHKCPYAHMLQLSLRMISRHLLATEAIKALRSITTAARVERGFAGSRIFQDVENPEALCLEEDWNSEQELRSHIRSSCFTNLLLLMETSPEAPVLEFRAVSGVSGLEYVQAVRFGDHIREIQENPPRWFEDKRHI